MKRKNDQSWKPLAHILSACGIPWIWYLADFIFSLLISMVTVRLPQMTGAIMQGEIFDKGLLADYVGITVFFHGIRLLDQPSYRPGPSEKNMGTFFISSHDHISDV